MLNETGIIGFTGSEAELRYVGEHKRAVLNFSVAVNKRKRDGSQKTTWFRITVWGEYAEVMEPYISKGRLVHIKGEIDGSAYIDKHDKAQYVLELTADKIVLLDRPDFDEDEKPRERQSNRRRERPSRSSRRRQERPEPAYEDMEVDDIPF